MNPETPKNPQQVSITLELMAPPRVPGRARVDELLKLATPHAYATLLEFESMIESPALLAYLGHRLGEACKPELIPHMELGLRLKSFPFLEGLLSSLATHEYHALVTGLPPRLEGQQYSNVRSLLAQVCCEPGYAVLEDAWKKRREEIFAVSTLPLTILRRCAGREVAEVALKALLKGGILPFMNSKALDLLKLYEERSTAPRLGEDQIIGLVGLFGEDLRDPLVHASATSLMSTWLSKHQDAPPREVRNLLLGHVEKLVSGSALDVDNELLKLLSTLTLLRHYKDNGVQDTFRQAVKLNDPCISPLALLCRADSTPNHKNYLKSIIHQTDDFDDRLAGLRVFGQSISPSVDVLTFPILSKYLIESDGMLSDDRLRSAVFRERRVLLENASRRFLCEPVDSPFLTGLLHAVTSEAPEFRAVKTFAANVLMEVSTSGRLPPVWFYDDTSRLVAVRAAIACVQETIKGITFKGVPSPAEQLEAYFFHVGPKHYGFEINYG